MDADQVTVILKTDSSYQVAWQYGRYTRENGHDHGRFSSNAMTFRTAEVSQFGRLTSEKELANRVCDCCQTTGAMTENSIVLIIEIARN